MENIIKITVLNYEDSEVLKLLNSGYVIDNIIVKEQQPLEQNLNTPTHIFTLTNKKSRRHIENYTNVYLRTLMPSNNTQFITPQNEIKYQNKNATNKPSQELDYIYKSGRHAGKTRREMLQENREFHKSLSKNPEMIYPDGHKETYKEYDKRYEGKDRPSFQGSMRGVRWIDYETGYKRYLYAVSKYSGKFKRQMENLGYKTPEAQKEYRKEKQRLYYERHPREPKTPKPNADTNSKYAKNKNTIKPIKDFWKHKRRFYYFISEKLYKLLNNTIGFQWFSVIEKYIITEEIWFNNIEAIKLSNPRIPEDATHILRCDPDSRIQEYLYNNGWDGGSEGDIFARIITYAAKRFLETHLTQTPATPPTPDASENTPP
jgi:hypothetical protein